MWEYVLYSSIAIIIIIILMLIVFYLLNSKNLKAQKKHFKEVHKNLKVGDQVLILNGIYGEVAKLGDEIIDLRLKSGQLMEVSRYSVSKITKSK
ncbi:preprotein translocase subunit YajC [Vagococcus sp.]|uniref:preprotein translocase subunit YajC n=1 Tax=Vagococcus sp. TaxID=1933889 RepID=UPI003F99FE57